MAAAEKSVSIEDAGMVLSTVSSLLDTVDWPHLVDVMRSADTVGPILDPTAYNAALHNGRLNRNQLVLEATARYVDVLRDVAEGAKAAQQ